MIVFFILAIICIIISYVSLHLLLTRIEIRQMGIEKQNDNEIVDLSKAGIVEKVEE